MGLPLEPQGISALHKHRDHQSSHSHFWTCYIMSALLFPGPQETCLDGLPFPISAPPSLSRKSMRKERRAQAFLDRNKKLNPHHSTTTTPIIIPANLNIATLFPCCAIRPSRPAEPFIELVIEEKTSDYITLGQVVSSGYSGKKRRLRKGAGRHTLLSMTCWSRALS